MTINKTQNDSELIIALDGRLDTSTAPELESELANSLEGVTALVFNFEALEYISSAGLRVLLGTQKRMNAQGTMKIKGSNDTIKEVFDITGFTDILTLED